MSKTQPLTVRDREYDVNSWSGVKLIAKLLFVASMTIGGVLAVYYGYETAQTRDITTLQEKQSAFKDETLRVFVKIDNTLNTQQRLLGETRESVAEQRATAVGVGHKVDRLVISVESLSREVNQLGRRLGSDSLDRDNSRNEATESSKSVPSM